MNGRMFIAVLCCLFLSSCASGYEKFYQPLPANNPAGIAPFSGEPQLLRGDPNPTQTVAHMFEQGYWPIGVSDFVGPAANVNDALGQAKSVGAAVVAITSKYQSTATGAFPLTLPNNTTSYTTGSANVVGTGGFATGSYNGLTTTYGTQTTMIPYSVDRYEQVAIYFAPLKRQGAGFMYLPLTDTQRQQLRTNQAVSVVAIRTGSPAFLADFLPGDAILSINGQRVYDIETGRRALLAAVGRSSNIVLIRNGQQITKTLMIPLGEW
jgi:membrane-associated protease RseP (regulator of RpoE activity)